jgi:hypothetical protein
MNSIRPNFAESPGEKFYGGTKIEQHARAKDWNLDADNLGSPVEKFDIPEYGLAISLDPNIKRADFRGMAKAQQAMRTADALIADAEQKMEVAAKKFGVGNEYCVAEDLLDDNLEGARVCTLGQGVDTAWEHRVVELSDGSKQVTDIAYKAQGNLKQYAIRDSSGAYVVSQNGNGTLSITVYDGQSETKV